MSAFGDAGCVSGSSNAAGHSLEYDQVSDHAVLEPACGLDTQLSLLLNMHRTTAAEVAMMNNRSGCEHHGQNSQAPSYEALFQYMRHFMRPTFYSNLPKMVAAC